MSGINLVTTDYIRNYLGHLDALLKTLDTKQISKVGELLSAARYEGRQVFICGNGGNASLASSLAHTLNKGCSRNREKRFKAMALTDNIPLLTGLANDLAYEDVFLEQLKNFARKGDIFIALSGGGNAPNVLKALQYANQIGCESVGISGFLGGKLKELVHHHVYIKSDHLGHVENGQQIVCHILTHAFIDAEGLG
jgi:D-sedoheptulose 7-phosphate isomerase